MLKKTITYTDFNDRERTEDYYFNYTKAELTKMILESVDKDHPEGALEEKLIGAVNSGDGKRIMATFEEIILGSYGHRSEDGRHFYKTPEISRDFRNSAAYDTLFLELMTNQNAAQQFVNGLLPKSLMDAAQSTANTELTGRPTVPQDHQSPREKHRVSDSTIEEIRGLQEAREQERQDPYQRPSYLPETEAVLAPELKEVRISFAQLQDMNEYGRQELERRYAGWSTQHNADGSVTLTPPNRINVQGIEGFTTRPPHESGPQG